MQLAIIFAKVIIQAILTHTRTNTHTQTWAQRNTYTNTDTHPHPPLLTHTLPGPQHTGREGKVRPAFWVKVTFDPYVCTCVGWERWGHVVQCLWVWSGRGQVLTRWDLNTRKMPDLIVMAVNESGYVSLGFDSCWFFFQHPRAGRRHLRYAHIYTHAKMYIYVYVYINMCVCVCVYIYIYTYTHAHTHTHTHMPSLRVHPAPVWLTQQVQNDPNH